ncbi:MAG TPA: RdgB/HAM1 family non-canonical purine NTP pyrophosphatase [Gammaproteobacteria bacterium]|nr:RdgB/HAM1 family non-canonical purine NTP pyrophosphatase [Gammaproteobacteria bacterium]
MTLPAHWVLATSNRGKVAELGALLAEAGLAVRVTAQSELNVIPAPETAVTFVENALAKARHAARVTGLPAIADDSGLVVDALGGAPGVRSARFAGEDADDGANVAKLLTLLAGQALERRAHFHCVLVALTSPDDAAPLIASGSWHGEIARAARGSNGFGYDPVFFDPTLRCTAAQLGAAEKNRVSHRGTALRRLIELLKNR